MLYCSVISTEWLSKHELPTPTSLHGAVQVCVGAGNGRL